MLANYVEGCTQARLSVSSEWERDLPARYYFHLKSALDAILDDEGVEAEDDANAIKQASDTIEEMRSSGELPDTNATWLLVIQDDQGKVVLEIPV